MWKQGLVVSSNTPTTKIESELGILALEVSLLVLVTSL